MALADVTLLLEGTYPYVSGGVSAWVHQIISALPELRFALQFLGGDRASYGEARYKLPENVVALSHHYLQEPGCERPARGRPGAALLTEIDRLHEHLREGALPPPALLGRALDALGAAGGLTRDAFLRDGAVWAQLGQRYQRHSPSAPFVDFFWTVRALHLPLLGLGELLPRVPPARAYHSISTGFAGMLGALLKRRTGRPFLLTEHGIYTKERQIELGQAEWIRDEARGVGLRCEEGVLRGLWGRFFASLGRIAYDAADPIITLYEGNRQRQVQDGAAEERTLVIPNGVDLGRFTPLRAQRPAEPPRVLGLIGRVVPIKDVRTFVQALAIARQRLPGVEGWIIGPMDEDRAYAAECQGLAAGLGLGEAARFLGLQKIDQILPQLGLLVLTSISEALPLVLLEAFAAGLPALATDVGSCREIIEGGAAADRALGSAGAVVPIASPEATAAAAVALLTDGARWRAAQQAGIARVERFYTQRQMIDRYREVYQRATQGAGGG